MQLLKNSKFNLWQRPRELRDLAVKAQANISAEAFLSRGGDFEQKIQEVLVGTSFAMLFHKIVFPVRVRMAQIHEEATDIELRSGDGVTYPFEITTVYPPGYKIRLEYRDGRRPVISKRAFSGEPIPAEWIADAIVNKTNKVRGKGLRRHLLVYNNISGGTTNLWRLPQLLCGAEGIWDSIWIIAGIPYCGWISLVSNEAGLKVSERSEGFISGGLPTFWGYWIDRWGLKIFDSAGGVYNG